MPGPVAATVPEKSPVTANGGLNGGIERCLTQRPVAIRALGWRLRVEDHADLLLRNHDGTWRTFRSRGQSPLPGEARKLP
jgi:hypothetical protein